MKRRIDSDVNNSSLDHSSSNNNIKRRSSSLFSISTIQEAADSALNAPSPSFSCSDKNHTQQNNNHALLKQRRGSSTASPYATETEISEEEGGFFIEDEEEEFDNAKSKSSSPAMLVNSADTTLLPAVAPKIRTDLRTGLASETGARHFDRHNRLHKERPIRITSVMEHLQRCNLTYRCQLLEAVNIDMEESPEGLFLQDEDYLRVHLPGYMQRIESLNNCSCCDRLDREAEQYKSIFFTPDSVKEARIAATSLCRLVSKVVQGELNNGFAIIRPPGHHAEPSLAGGYCIINNVAVAAAYAREKLKVKRILICDWDVHLGNGTQSIFLNDPNVLYFSVHRWHGGNFYPFLQNGGPSNVGLNSGAGYNINVGWSRKGMGDDEYLAIWERVLMPVAMEYKPDLVLVSAGFDAAKGDMGECLVTPECFGRLTRSLMTLADGKVVCTLEGGYVRSVLEKCIEQVVTSLLDPKSAETSKKEVEQDICDRDGADVLETIDSTAAKNIESTIAAHRKYWSCFQAQKSCS